MPSFATAANAATNDAVYPITGSTPAQAAPPTTSPAYITRRLDVSYSGKGSVLISGSQDGSASFAFYDSMQIFVSNSAAVDVKAFDGSSASADCKTFSKTPPVDISKYLIASITNHVAIYIYNRCPVHRTDPLYLVVKGSAPSPAASDCPDVQFIGVRGSGETSTDVDGYGRTIGHLRGDLVQALPQLASAEVEYPAIKVDPADPDYGSKYIRSVAVGVRMLDRMLYKLIRSCPNTRIILAGYSQGAQVVGDAFMYLPPLESRHIRALVLFGDPEFNPAQKMVDFGNYNPLLSGSFQLVDRYMHKFAASDLPRIHSYCLSGDPICNWSLQNVAICAFYLPTEQCAHQEYADSADQAAVWASRQAYL